MNIPILIPAYNPDEKLLDLIRQLLTLGFKDIIIVDDGSQSGSQPVLSKIRALANCHVLHHAANLGKGRALKTGLNYYILNFKDSAGIVTADADGQHKAEDIKKIADILESDQNQLVLGVRQFKGQVPWKSLAGNLITKKVFQVLVGKNLADTQSGLRGIPYQYVVPFVKLPGERYEYEIEMLLATRVYGLGIKEVPVATIYIDNNKDSHFNPLLDSMRVYFLFLRFAFSSLLASLIDLLVFITCFKITANLAISIFTGRFVIGTMVNYIINKNLVFHDHRRVLVSAGKYYLLLLAMGALSFLLIQNLNKYFGVPVIIAKVVVETMLFFMSFAIQRDLIFVNKSLES